MRVFFGLTNASTLIGFLVYVGEIVGARHRGLVISISVACRIFGEYLWAWLLNKVDFNMNICFSIVLLINVVVVIFNYMYTFESDTFTKFKKNSEVDTPPSQESTVLEVTASDSPENIDQVDENEKPGLAENAILDCRNLESVFDYRLIAKAMALVIMFRLPIFTIRNPLYLTLKYANLFEFYEFTVFSNAVICIATILLIVVMGMKTGIQYRRMSLAQVSVFATAFFFAISWGLIFILPRFEYSSLCIALVKVLIELSVSIGMYHLADQFLVELLPGRRRGFLMAIIICVESVLNIVYTMFLLHFYSLSSYLLLSITCVFTGCLIHFQLERLYNLFG